MEADSEIEFGGEFDGEFGVLLSRRLYYASLRRVVGQAPRPRRASPPPPRAGRRCAVAGLHARERAAAAAQGGPLRAQGHQI